MVCQRLKKKSAEICSLKYAASTSSTESITINSDFTKLKVSTLKAYMAEKGIECPECIEKEDFVARIKKALSAKKDL